MWVDPPDACDEELSCVLRSPNPVCRTVPSRGGFINNFTEFFEATTSGVFVGMSSVFNGSDRQLVSHGAKVGSDRLRLLVA